ncbi:hypothetical protein INS49_014596 [Diaporthe citri]|uniref:uncharacterized protein n=1 Tax=Diaporthe citri TaxID=83186 RepID=UPI001C81128F|nr:uncharacterized protein INS49_014596 [Diaporthe citri]KAG6356722.1 hypothetical protein INS49_014596 [Diaporthe citri]
MSTRTTTISGLGPTMTYYPVTTPEPWPPIFMYGARPLSLDGGQIEKELPPTELDQNSHRLRVDCPNGNTSHTTRTPEEEDADKQCVQADLFPAEWYRNPGTDSSVTIFGGTYTPSAAPEKTWRCEMTVGELHDTLVGGDCSLWETPSGAADASTIATTGLGRCAVSRQYVPVRLTAGELAGSWGTGASYWFDPTNANNEAVTALSSERCPDPTSLLGFVAATATATSGTAGSATRSTSAASAGTAFRGDRTGPAALVCVALACARVAGLLSLPL